MRRSATSADVYRVVAHASWIVPAFGVLVSVLVGAGSEERTAILLPTMAVFFPLLILRLLLAARLHRARRTPLVLLAVTIGTWSLGSVAVNAASLEAQTHFPAPGEWFFLFAYLGLACYLVTDIDRRHLRATRRWLDALVICGASTSLASLLLVTPIRLASGADGLTLLLALLYPLADMALAVLVLGQALLGSRADARKSLMLGGGLVLLACADSGFALQVSAPTYHFGNLSYALWGAAWITIASAACRRTPEVARSATALPKAVGTWMVLVAGAIALTVLTIQPDDTLLFYTLPPAVVTMLAVGARLALALRDANRVTEALVLSQTDDLTMLPNRRAVRSRLTTYVNSGRPHALMMLDLDGFKEINDALGHHAGDIVLKALGARMREAAGPGVMVARLGGDEFAILLDTVDEIELMETAHELLDTLADPVVVEDIEIVPRGSIGITVIQADDTGSGEVMRRADVAMYQAKSSRAGAVIYDAHLDEHSRSRLELTEDLRRGILDGQIEVWYQPQIDAATMQVQALEALVRWRHPVRGLLGPVAFLPAARRVGLMGLLSDNIAWQAARDLRRFVGDGLDVRISINCAPPELLSQTFVPRLHASLEEWEVPAERVVIEVTEDSFLTEPERARAILLDLHERGIQVAIDDYGTGFSSLTHLRNLPVQELKIDRSLVRGVSADERSRMIVASTIQLAHALDMRIVAEGVESASDMTMLVSMGIDSLQGYHLARPMPAAEVTRWVKDWTTTAALFGRDPRTQPPPSPEVKAAPEGL